jgi:hypothetical protein
MIRTRFLAILILACGAQADVVLAAPLGTAFTYQGQLKQNALPYSGAADFIFNLYSSDVSPFPLVTEVTLTNVNVINGLFSVDIDFGLALNGEERWLETAVRAPAGSGSYTTLAPRQRLAPAPYAVQSRGLFVDDNGHLGVGTQNPGDAQLVVLSQSELAGRLYREDVGDSSIVEVLDITALLAGFGATQPGFGSRLTWRLEAPNYALSQAGTIDVVYADPVQGRTYMAFRTRPGGAGAMEHMRISPDGDVGIGTTSPAARLDVAGDGDYVLRARSTALTGVRFGVYGETKSPSDGAGVFGRATHGTGLLTKGVWGVNDGADGYGVYGQATSTSGTAIGVSGITAAADGRGVSGLASSTATAGTGVYGIASAAGATGVWGSATHTTGNNIAVGGQTLSPNGYAAYFTGGRNYFGGNTGIGTGAGSIDARLHVQANGARVAKFDRYNSDGELVAWARDDIVRGNVTVSGNTVSYNAFTGSHYAWCAKAPERGTLMRMTGENRALAGGGEPIYGVAPTSAANDPACLGAYLGTAGIDASAEQESVHLVAAVGNGDLWVVDTGTDIAPGDLLISSDAPGCAMRDDPARFAAGHVIARAAQAVRWDEVTIDQASHRRVRISVLFGAFTRGQNPADLESHTSAGGEPPATSAATIAALRAENARLGARLSQLEEAFTRWQQGSMRNTPVLTLTEATQESKP